jgi:hypothetical protein
VVKAEAAPRPGAQVVVAMAREGQEIRRTPDAVGHRSRFSPRAPRKASVIRWGSPPAAWYVPTVSLSWNAAQEEAVAGVLARYPAESNRCVELARAVLPLARQLDAGACVRLIRPRVGRYVAPKQRMPKPWFTHAVTEATLHYLDAFTGPPGIEGDRYLVAHFEHPEDHDVREVDLATLLGYGDQNT